MTKNKYIFIDFDGVLNNLGQCDVSSVLSADKLDSTSVGILQFICRCTGAKLVISSSWRLLHSDTAWYVGMFNSYGWRNVEVVGITPNKNGHKGTEIAEWISNHRGQIDRYVIVDDNSDVLPDQAFVHVDGIVGLTMYDAVDIIDILDVLPGEAERYLALKEHVTFSRNKHNE